jgi:hypothetical protein
MSTKTYNNTFIRVAGQLQANGVSRAAFAAAFADNDKDTVRFPGNAELRTAILEHRQYGRIAQPRLKWILSELELASHTKFDETKGLQDDLSIEHVLPDAWTTHWRLSDGMNARELAGSSADQLAEIERRDRLKHTLGNLTLLTSPANAEALNYGFARKLERLKLSLLRLNQEIAREEQWDEGAIQRRAARLADLAVAIWPAPQAAS